VAQYQYIIEYVRIGPRKVNNDRMTSRYDFVSCIMCVLASVGFCRRVPHCGSGDGLHDPPTITCRRYTGYHSSDQRRKYINLVNAVQAAGVTRKGAEDQERIIKRESSLRWLRVLLPTTDDTNDLLVDCEDDRGLTQL